MKKRITALFLAVALLCALLPAAVLTASAKTYSGTCGGDLTWTLDTETGVLEISGTGEMRNWLYPDDVSWHSYRDSIKSVSIGNGVTSIGKSSFYDCKEVTTVSIPGSMTSIGESAFALCKGLTSVTIPDGVMSIGSSAFYNCTSLTSVTIPDSVTSIGDFAFRSCTKLTSISIDPGNEYYCMMDGVLYSKDKTTLICYPGGKAGESFSIPDSVTSLGSGAFAGCTGLTRMLIPNSVTSIGDSAFHSCTGLTSVTLPGSVTSTGEYTFYGCTGLTSITIPNSVTCIGNGAFYGCTGLKRFTISDSVTSIGFCAFYDCTGLTAITIPDSVKRIGEMALINTGYFNNGSNWTGGSVFSGALYVGHHLIHVGDTVSGIYSIRAGTKTIACGAFDQIEKLTGVKIPASVTYLEALSFYGCSRITSLVVDGGNPVYDSRNNCNAIIETSTNTLVLACVNSEIPAGVTSIAEHAFFNCWRLTSLTIPDSMTSIPAGVFTYCAGMTSILIPNTVKSIGEGAFDDCDSLTDVYFTGTEAEWNAIKIGRSNNYLTKAAIHFNFDSDSSPFSDVSYRDYYYQAVLWAAGSDPQITNGTGATTFSPNDTCTRAQVVTFLWRTKGCPEPKSADNPFGDVKEGAYYYKAVLWAVENEITTGTSATTFSPNAGCTRAQVVTFLWRTEGQPKPSSFTNPFGDVGVDYYYDAVLWAVENKITNGTSYAVFSPDYTCTRGQIVTFLYRAFAE